MIGEGVGPAARLRRLRRQMEALQIPALLITNVTNLQYVTGFTGSAGQALVTPERAVFFADPRYHLQAEREVPHFQQVRWQPPKKAFEAVGEFLSGLGLGEVRFEGSLPYSTFEELAEKLPGVVLTAVKDVIEGLRLVKDADEVQRIREAAAVTDASYQHVLPFLRPGTTEREVAVEIECFLRRAGAQRESFATIVASGVRGANPHAGASEKPIAAGDLVTMDFGALVRGYAADITRTVAVGRADEKQREVYTVVLEAQEAAIAAIRPGRKGAEIDRVARDLISARGYGDYFKHGLGHSLGRDVHDGPGFSMTSEVLLEPGMVMTVEPGIYIPGWGGVRIEEDIVVTEAGAEVLTRAPKTFTVVAAE